MKKSVKNLVVELLSKKFDEPEFNHIFLVDVTANQKAGFLRIYIDGDSGVTFSDCQTISRYIESYLDESDDIREDYTLEVSSPGVKRPLELLRQYPQHIGRSLKVDFIDKKSATLKLVEVNGKELVFETIPKKKKIEVERKTVAFDEIKESTVKLSFK